MISIETKAVVFDGNNTEEINELLSFFGHSSKVQITQDKIYRDLDEAKAVTEDFMRGDTIHGEPDFYSIDPDNIVVYTEKGKHTLQADVPWNRYDKTYYYIDGEISFTETEFVAGAMPSNRYLLDSHELMRGEVVVANSIHSVILNQLK